ncbi:hypothetical protein RJ640_019722 [Escallonia rubra]|uniref:FLZ-type domain-containing protein n=1 Tax=Escallonia rubra TaxID=112253 RepID=A0AA88RIF1_9ASTE|nr:hypothetical protein RJ640_019722 [Escallonia rubra]
MSFKRSPIGKSSGSGETNLRRRVSPPPPPSAVGNTDDPSRPRIMTVSSPEQERSEVVGEGGFGRFLEKCHYCNKRIQKNAEVFMYSHFLAFCTAECRDFQIALDKEAEARPASSHGSNNSESQLGL